MPITFKTANLYYKDSVTGNYIGINGIGDTTHDIIAVDYADLVFPVSEGQHCVYEGQCYKAKQDIQTSEQWTSAHWEAVTIASELENLEAANIDDVQINGTSIISSGIANIPLASSTTFGVIKCGINSGGVGLSQETNAPYIVRATNGEVKSGSNAFNPIVPSTQHISVFYGLSKLAGADLASDTATVGTYPEASKTAIRALIGAISKSDIAGSTGETRGVAFFNANYGIGINGETGGAYVSTANSSLIKAGANQYKPIVPYSQHESVFYGLAKAAGVDMASSNNAVGSYTTDAKDAISDMLGVIRQSTIGAGLTATYDVTTGYLDSLYANVQDVQINGISIVSSGVVNIPMAGTGGSASLGVSRAHNSYGTAISANGDMVIVRAYDSGIKLGGDEYRPIVPYNQHQSVFYGLSKVAGVDLANETVTVGIYPTASKTAIRSLIGATSDKIVAVQDTQPTETDSKIWMMETAPSDVEVPTYAEFQALDAAVVKKTDIATTSTAGIVKINSGFGIYLYEDQLRIYRPTDAQIKAGNNNTCPITPSQQDISVFYGLAKAAGDSTQAASDNAVGTYTTTASAAIRTMIGAGTPLDVQVNGASIINNGIANISKASSNNLGVVKINTSYGIGIANDGSLFVRPATEHDIQEGSNTLQILNPSIQHISTFYGLAKAASDTTQAQSSNAVGTYTADAKAAIQTMLGAQAAIEVIRL